MAGNMEAPGWPLRPQSLDGAVESAAPRPAPNKEVELARRLIAGDESAFEPFVSAFQTKLFQYTYLTCGQREDAEEVAQETLLKVFENLAQLREPEKVRPWVFRIARNVCYMKRRKSIYAPEEEISLDQLMPSFKDDGGGRRIEIADWKGLPDTLAMKGELRDMLREAIGDLPDLYRNTLLLRDVEELSTEETAEVLGVSADVVKTRLHRARLMLRQRLDAQLLAGVRP
ncbi:MAG: sigma-70 family RNA polymerase sigma factor [Bryobacterales bacterium]|nr:sigma-70 family RNA polymerase sigma factor [Bryobacterales bacterium]